MHKKIQATIVVGLLIAMEIILTRVFSIENSIVRVSFEFLPVALSAILFGPLTAGIAAAIADVLGMIIFPKGAYFPGFTLSAFLNGFIYGVFLYKRNLTIFKALLSSLCAILVVSLCLNTLWLTYITGNGAFAIASASLVKCAFFLPLQTFGIHLLWKLAMPVINGYFPHTV